MKRTEYSNWHLFPLLRKIFMNNREVTKGFRKARLAFRKIQNLGESLSSMFNLERNILFQEMTMIYVE